jgi:hypothetical protein
MHDEIRRLEESHLNGEARRSSEKLARLLSDDFVEFGSSGRVYDKRTVLAALASDDAAPFVVTDFRTTLLAPGVALATYRATRTNATGSAASLRSSIWKRDAHGEKAWRLVFHQGTRVDPA